MKNIRRFTFSFAVVMLFSGVAMALPSAAHGQAANNDNSSKGQTLAQQYRQMAQSYVQAAKLNHQTQSQTHRQAACEARKAAISTRMTDAVSFATTHKAVFDKIYQRIQTFYTTKKLNVSNYDSLKSAVDTAQSNAQAQIEALKTLDVNIDCSSQTVASSVSAFKQAVQSARDSLKAYRAALVNLINSLKGASTGTSAAGGSDTNSSNTTNQ